MTFHIQYYILRMLSTLTQSTLVFFVFYMSKFGIGIVGVFGISVAAELIWTEKS